MLTGGEVLEPKPSSLIKVNYHISSTQDAMLGSLKSGTGMSKSEHVRRALDAYLSSLSKEHYRGI